MSALEELRRMNIEAQKRYGASSSRDTGSSIDLNDHDEENVRDNSLSPSDETSARPRNGSPASIPAGEKPGNNTVTTEKSDTQNEILELIPVIPRAPRVKEPKSSSATSPRGSGENRELDRPDFNSSRVNYLDRQIDSYLDRQIDSYPDRQIDDDHAINGEGDIITDPAEIDQLRRDLNAARKTATKNVNFKMPTALNDALAAYIAENWKTRPQKQDIIAYGIQLALMRLRTGGSLTELDDDFTL
jgi:hypothetical protein